MSRSNNKHYHANNTGDANIDVSSNNDLLYSQFCKVLGEALCENDDYSPSTYELALETYRQLCYDEPIVTSEGCQALAKALLRQESNNRNALSLSNSLQNHSSMRQHENIIDRSNENTAPMLALSQPLVNGLRQYINSSRQENQEADNQSSSLSLLAWRVFGDIPYQCILREDLQLCQRLLGSFPANATGSRRHHGQDQRHRPREEHSDPTEPQDTSKDTHAQQELDLPFLDKNNNHDAMDDDDIHHDKDAGGGGEDDDIWADESDPSDFEFESGYDPEQTLRELDAWAQQQDDMFDPTALSATTTAINYQDVSHALISLLESLHYRHLAGLSITSDSNPTKRPNLWLQYKISETLSSLVLLLVAPSGPLLACQPHHVWQELAWYPLHVLRDAAQDQPSRHLSAYLKLLQQLFQIQRVQRQHHQHEHYQEPQPQSHLIPQQEQQEKYVANGASQISVSMAPATWMGLTLWAQLGTSHLVNRRHIERLREALLASIDDLTLILECLASFYAQPLCEDETPWNKTANAVVRNILSIMNIFVDEDTPCPLTTMDAQKLLSSGFLRQFIRLYQDSVRTLDSNSRSELLYTTLLLSLQTPALVGKYVWRYPGLAHDGTSAITTVSGTTRLFWNALGTFIEQEGPGPRIQWRKKEKAPISAPSMHECQESIREEFSSIVKGVACMLERGNDDIRHSLQPSTLKFTDPLIEEWDRLASSVMGNFVVRQGLRSCYKINCGLNEADDLTKSFAHIKLLLSNYKSARSTGSSHVRHTKQDTLEDPPAKTREAKLDKDLQRADYDTLIHRIRMSLKLLMEAFDANNDAKDRPSNKAD